MAPNFVFPLVTTELSRPTEPQRIRPVVTIITHFPSPYQVELFDAVAGLNKITLHVVYLRTNSPARRWQSRSLRHNFAFGDGLEQDISRAREVATQADLLVFNYYRHPLARDCLVERAASRRPWAFWGERLGFRFSHLVGSIYRRWALRHLARSRAPIWGIGRWAVESYRAEFGNDHPYRDLPYFSDLSRFTRAVGDRRPVGDSVCFLYSGSLIKRKGVDLLAGAFRRLAAVQPKIRLRLLGDGPLLPSLRHALASCGDRVEFLGFKDWHELPAVYAAADVLCVPSRHDGWGLVVPEALAAGLPVIGTTCTGAAREFLRTGHNGWLVRADNGEALFQALCDANRQGSSRLSCMSRNARESVAEHTLEHGAARLVAACRSALESWNH